MRQSEGHETSVRSHSHWAAGLFIFPSLSKYFPKCFEFMYLGMLPWTQLAMLNHNVNVEMELAVMKDPDQGQVTA